MSVTLRTCIGFGGGAAAAMFAVTVCPAIVEVKVCALPEFAAVVNLMVPLPLPDAGDAVSDALLVDAVHVGGEHPAGVAVNVTSSEPPPEANDTDAGDTEKLHARVAGGDGAGAGVGADCFGPEQDSRASNAANVKRVRVLMRR